MSDQHAIMWSLDLDALVDLLGYSREELLRMTIFETIAPEERERLDKHLPVRPTTGDVGEWTLKRKNGSRVTLHIRFHDVEVGTHRISFRYATQVREAPAAASV